jgi:hypothetical protein
MRLPCLLLFLALVVPPSFGGELYRIVGPDGKVSYSDRPADGPAAKTVRLVAGASSSSSSGDPTVMEAVIKVLTMEGTVQDLTRFCGRFVPETSRPVREARDEWVARNKALTVQRNKVARDVLSMSEMVSLAATMDTEARKKTSLATEATPAMKKTWCLEAPKNFGAREMDPSRDLALTRVLMTHTFKKK